jgi:hypothetical protein
MRRLILVLVAALAVAGLAAIAPKANATHEVTTEHTAVQQQQS